MKLFKKLTLAAVTSLVAVTTLVGSASAASGISGKITINGSTALLPLTLQAAKEFQKINPKVRISASGKGSVTGPQAVKKGIADIGACDWDASMDVPGFKAFEGQVANKVAVIPFATVTNKNVKVNNLTTEQLKGIFSGKITNWKEVGGDDADIVVITRAFGSGTRVNYQAKALAGGDIVKKAKNYKEVGSSGDMKTAVATTPNAIGYIDLVYVNSDIKALSYNGVQPTTDNVINGSYKIWAYGYYMTKGQPTGATKAFIEYVQSAKFQQGSLKKLKFIPISAMR
ncbi:MULTISPECIES: phosphate ABC transporter substrate-binding protein [Paenibacillus]|uniref:phosphate ABC transporter substrate-binding protein n=1 Tax=Paenibacillus TaxID=44249 RepID=UPI000E282301|nr:MULTISPECIES: phosphate ABC transporter substrate-binding protein [Paenibacillus]MBJ9992221.1 phosphate ABC transporter substrate-binding protein [Paenibacillus sp. S28]MCM3001927.1 phosphate ABC transporter substrate-binding protein [Paenibacillus cellulositrophicus]RED31684.1 phosphate ABC transporter substrate-binding protein (PhoT family) [Paenibacillus sp. VMFN-D1]GIO64483.1 phosphate-binding protein [Paenibacillus cineris]